MVFWIGAVLVALAAAAYTGMRLIRRQSNPAWPAACGFALAMIAAFGAAVQATIASLEAPQQIAGAATAAANAGAGAAGGADPGNDSFEALIAKLEAGLQANPDDPERWGLLGRSYIALGRLEDAVNAFKQALDRSGTRSPELLGEYAEALVAAADGKVSGAPEAAFAEVLELAPGDPRAIFYLAEAQVERGALDSARAQLQSLLNNAPADAPWRATVFERLQEIDAMLQSGAARPEGAPAPNAAPAAASAAAPGPTAEDIAAAQEMTPEARAEMIRGMVDGLAEKMAANPDDFAGWLRLANAYRVLGDNAKAASALKAATLLQPANVPLLIQYAEVQIAADAGVVTADAELALNRAAARQPGNPQVLWRLGQAAAARGETEKARALWTELMPKLLIADPLKAEVKAALDAL